MVGAINSIAWERASASWPPSWSKKWATALLIKNLVSSSAAHDQLACIISNWIRACDLHPACQEQGTFTVLPDRVLDLQNPTQTLVRLHEPGNSSGRYIALSYCWGHNGQYTLRTRTMDKLKEGLPMGNLPSTIQDAIYLTKNSDVASFGSMHSALCKMAPKTGKPKAQRCVIFTRTPTSRFVPRILQVSMKAFWVHGPRMKFIAARYSTRTTPKICTFQGHTVRSVWKTCSGPRRYILVDGPCKNGCCHGAKFSLELARCSGIVGGQPLLRAEWKYPTRRSIHLYQMQAFRLTACGFELSQDIADALSRDHPTASEPYLAWPANLRSHCWRRACACTPRPT